MEKDKEMLQTREVDESAATQSDTSLKKNNKKSEPISIFPPNIPEDTNVKAGKARPFSPCSFSPRSFSPRSFSPRPFPPRLSPIPLLQQKEFRDQMNAQGSYYDDACTFKEAYTVCRLKLEQEQSDSELDSEQSDSELDSEQSDSELDPFNLELEPSNSKPPPSDTVPPFKERNGTAFFATYGQHYGIFTNNHVLNEELLIAIHKSEIRATLQFKCKDSQIHEFFLGDYLKECFCFTCDVLDITFIKFEKRVYEELRQKVEFLHLYDYDPQFLNDKATNLIVIQRPAGTYCTKMAKGLYQSEFGIDFLHRVSTNSGSSGSPVIEDVTKYVIGIHKAEIRSKDCNLAVSMQVVLNAFNSCIRHYVPGEKEMCVFCNPRYKECKKELVIPVLGDKLQLVKVNATDWPAYHYEQAEVCKNDLKENTSIWFIPTIHGWYWTPMKHLLGNHLINFMTITQSKITGGCYNDYQLTDNHLLAIMEKLPTIVAF